MSKQMYCSENRKVLFTDCDGYCIVHNSKYIQWCIDNIYDCLADYLVMRENNIKDIHILDIKCRYLKALKLGDSYEIKTELEWVDQTKGYIKFIHVLSNHKTYTKYCKCQGMVKVKL